jgi:hypothetical protein
MKPRAFQDKFMVNNFSVPVVNMPLFGVSRIKHKTELLFLNGKYTQIFSLYIFEETKWTNAKYFDNWFRGFGKYVFMNKIEPNYAWISNL